MAFTGGSQKRAYKRLGEAEKQKTPLLISRNARMLIIVNNKFKESHLTKWIFVVLWTT